MRDIMEHKEDIHGIESLVETGEICDEDLQNEIEKGSVKPCSFQLLFIL